MGNAALVFGADGGGTKTSGVLALSDGSILSHHQLGASNPNVVGIEESARILTDLMEKCCNEAGRSMGNLGAAVFGLAGAGSPAIRDGLKKALQSEFNRRGSHLPLLVIETDARIALEAAFGGGVGVIVIAGTGSVVMGKSTDGSIVRVGGWGRILGDEGSGYSIGLEGLREVVRDIDGISQAPLLRRMVEDRFGWSTREQIIVSVYQENFPIPTIAPLVLEAAQAGDSVARGILSAASKPVAEQIARAAKLIKTDTPVSVVFLGGLIDHDTVYSRILNEEISRVIPGAVTQPAEQPSAIGALLMAQELLKTKR